MDMELDMVLDTILMFMRDHVESQEEIMSHSKLVCAYLMNQVTMRKVTLESELKMSMLSLITQNKKTC